MKKYLLAAGVMLCPAFASAQELPSDLPKPEDKSVAERYRPDYQPIGGRLGSFFLFPTLAIDADATDNLFASDDDKVTDGFAVVRGEANLRSNWSVHALNAQAFVDQSVHAARSSEDVTQYGAQVDGRLDEGRDDYVGLLLRAEHLAEPRTSYTSPTNAREPVRYGQLTAALTTQREVGRVELLGGASVLRQAFADSRADDGTLLSQEYRNLTIVAVSGSAAYALSPDFSLLLSTAIDKRSYSLSPSSPVSPDHIDRASQGGRVEAGVKLSVASLLYGQVRLGYLSRRYDDPTLIDFSGLSFGADLLWNVTPITSLKLSADRRVDEASSTVIAGNRVTEFTLTLEHELLRSLILTGFLRHVDIAPIGPAPASPEFSGELGARYLASRQWSFRADYRYAQRMSDVFGRAFHENRLSLGALRSF